MTQNQQSTQLNGQNVQVQAPAVPKTAKNVPIYFPEFSGSLEDLGSIAYNKRVYLPLLESVLLEFGVGRSAFFRSKEVNEFRQIMKDAARERSYDDIDNLVKTSTETSTDSILMKFHKATKAKNDAYKETKQSVNEVMDVEAKSIIQKVAEEIPTTTRLVEQAATKVVLTEPKEKVLKKFTSIIDQQAKTFEPTAKAKAVNEAKKLVNKVRSDKEAGHLNNQSNIENKTGDVSKDLIFDIRDKAKNKGEASFRKFATINETSIYSAFAKVSTLVRQLVPNIGDTAGASFELNIPVGPGVIVIQLGANCSHDVEKIDATQTVPAYKQEYYSVGAEINIGGGGKISKLFVEASLKGTLGMFMESTGKKPEDALSMISYAMYRIMFNKFPDLTSSIWGNGGKTGFSKFEEAEMWAAMIESNMMNDPNSKVLIGLQAAFSAEAKSTDKFKGNYAAKGEGDLKFQKYYEYSKKVLNKAGIAHGSELEQLILGSNDSRLDKIRADDPSRANNQSFNAILVDRKAKFKSNIHHRSKVALSASTEFKFGDKAGMGASIEGALLFNHDSEDLTDLSKSNMKLAGIEFGISVSFPEGVKDLTIFNQIFPKVSDFAATVIGSKFNKSVDDSSKGFMIGREASLTVVNSALQSYVSGLKLDKTPFEDAWGSSLKAGFAFAFDFMGDDHSIDFEITREQSHEFDFEIAKFGIEKSKRIVKRKLL